MGPEDEKNYKLIRKVLHKDASTIEMYQVSYYQLSKLEPLVDAARELESTLHKRTKEEKSASWMKKLAKDADIAIGDEDERLLQELEDGESRPKKKKKEREVLAPIDVFEKDLDRVERRNGDPSGDGARHKQKALSKVQ